MELLGDTNYKFVYKVRNKFSIVLFEYPPCNRYPDIPAYRSKVNIYLGETPLRFLSIYHYHKKSDQETFSQQKTVVVLW